jgi:hypothetical protein
VGRFRVLQCTTTILEAKHKADIPLSTAANVFMLAENFIAE